jgi:hypothetical protein
MIVLLDKIKEVLDYILGVVMRICENKDILNIKSCLLEEIKLDEKYYLSELVKNINNVVKWKIFKFPLLGEFIPLLSPEVILNKENQFEKIGFLKLETDNINIVNEILQQTSDTAYGFTCDGNLVVEMRNPISHKNSLDCTLYNHREELIKCYSIRISSDKSIVYDVHYLNAFTSIKNNIQLEVWVNAEGDYYLYKVYEYKKNLVNKSYLYGLGWDSQKEYKFKYKSNVLVKITDCKTGEFIEKLDYDE